MTSEQGVSLILFLQAYAWALPFMRLASALGSLEFYILLVTAVYWCFDTRLGFRLALIMVLSQGLNDILKVVFHSPRPYWVSRKVMAFGSYHSFGLPSGHAQDSVCVWGYLANFSKKFEAGAIVIALIFIIGISRIYLGAHFPTDVVAGWVIGTLMLTLFLRLEPMLEGLFRRLDLQNQIIASFIASLSLLTIYALSLDSLGSWQIPSSWAENAMAATGTTIDPLNPEEVIGSAGVLFGMCTGYAWLRLGHGFRTDGPADLRLMRYILGMAGLALIWYGMGWLSAGQDFLVCYGLDYLRGMLEGAWVAAIAPNIFIKTGLAKCKG